MKENIKQTVVLQHGNSFRAEANSVCFVIYKERQGGKLLIFGWRSVGLSQLENHSLTKVCYILMLRLTDVIN